MVGAGFGQIKSCWRGREVVDGVLILSESEERGSFVYGWERQSISVEEDGFDKNLMCMVGYGYEYGDVVLLVHGVIKWIGSVKWRKLVWYGVVCDGRNLCLLFWDVKCSSRLQ
jgi:hypothetical protein